MSLIQNSSFTTTFGPRVRMPRNWAPGSIIDKRGLVISSNSMFTNSMPGIDTVGWSEQIGIDPQGLRFGLLFWDQLAFPSASMVGPPHGPVEQYLIEEGILIRPHYSGSGSATDLVHDSQTATFNHLEQIEPGVWALADGDLAFFSDRGLINQSGGSGLELFRAIPVPDIDVPLDEILSFKIQRRSELLNLRHQIDFYTRELLLKENINDALAGYVASIDKACYDVLRIFHEWKQPFRISNLKLSFDIRPFVPALAAIGTFTAAHTKAHLPMMHAGLAGLSGAIFTTAPFFKVAGDIGWNGLRERHSPFRYVKSYHREIFGR